MRRRRESGTSFCVIYHLTRDKSYFEQYEQALSKADTSSWNHKALREKLTTIIGFNMARVKIVSGLVGLFQNSDMWLNYASRRRPEATGISGRP